MLLLLFPAEIAKLFQAGRACQKGLLEELVIVVHLRNILAYLR